MPALEKGTQRFSNWGTLMCTLLYIISINQRGWPFQSKETRRGVSKQFYRMNQMLIRPLH